MDNYEELVQISKYLPEVKDRYYINRKGDLFTDNGTKRMKDGVKNGYVKNVLINKDGKEKSYFRHRLVLLCFDYRDDYK